MPTNRLARETSPYLLQHAHNPVDWYPWGPEAFAEARRSGKPILLSVGYAACHWCHVMERECFEDEAIAQQMNDLYVCVKVDREERPDVDAIYMAAVQTMTGQGGWPMTVFLTPEGEPFYGGTYFPPADRHGMPGFPRVLDGVIDAFRKRPDEVEVTARHLIERIAAQQALPVAAVSEATLDQALQTLARSYDARHGGFGGAPKFPPAMTIELLLRLAARKGDEGALAMAEHTLEQMARGGIYDHLGGGFHRYSVDERWLVPHFEKMLYDNALLARTYLLAFQSTRKVLYEVVATETLDYVVREMTGPEGQFYATQDADSEGEEGKFFVWSEAEVLEALGAEDGALFAAAFDVTRHGNFEGHNILHLPRPLGEVARERGVSLERLGEAVARGRTVLFELRERRIKPGRDEKAIAAWNGMMLEAFALAAAVLERDDYREVAERNAEFLLTTLMPGGKLMRTFKDGRSRIPAFLEDHANVIAGLLALYETTLTPRWLEAALDLATAMVESFWDVAAAGFYDTGHDHERLVTRPRDLFDNATPGGNSVAAQVLLRLARLTGDERARERGRQVLASAGTVMARYPHGAGRLLCALDFDLAPGHEVVLVGPTDAAGMRDFRTGLFYRYRPYDVLAGGEPAAMARLAERVPTLRDRPMRDDKPTAYVCAGQTCQLPVHEAAALLGLL